MIKQLSIRNFKSVRELDLSCRRVNVFIGEPNTGKTNVLEAMALRCRGCLTHFAEVFRSTALADLFIDQDTDNKIGVSFDDSLMLLRPDSEGATALFLQGQGMGGHQAYKMSASLEVAPNTIEITDGDKASEAKYYQFSLQSRANQTANGSLLPPFGENILGLLYSSKEARASSSAFLQGTGFKLNVDYTDKRLRISKQVDDLLISFPYSACSETLRRMIFFHLALDTNKDCILIFDEPEAHAYPPFTKRLAERIALDDRGNQFFLTTHSPYMLDSLLAKTPADDLNIVLCRMENFETKAYPLNSEQKAKLMEWSMDAFFNFDRLLDSDA